MHHMPHTHAVLVGSQDKDATVRAKAVATATCILGEAEAVSNSSQKGLITMLTKR